jgi:hypothetical protein
MQALKTALWIDSRKRNPSKVKNNVRVLARVTAT